MKQFVPNRHNQKLAVVIEESPNPTGLAFVMHGQGGFKEQAHIRTFVEAFLEKGFGVVSFDAANTLGESEGSIENADLTSYYSDLEDVIHWAESQEWYQEPFVLVGHSLGAISATLFAERYPGKVKGLAPIGTVVSGLLYQETVSQEKLEAWQRTGWHIQPSKSKPGVMKRLKWAVYEDMMKYDLLPNASRLTMPVLLMVGENDTSTPPQHQKILFDALPGNKELHIIPGSPHTFRDPEHLLKVKEILMTWIDKSLLSGAR